MGDSSLKRFISNIQRQELASLLDRLTLGEPVEVPEDEFSSLLEKNVVVTFPSLVDVIPFDHV